MARVIAHAVFVDESGSGTIRTVNGRPTANNLWVAVAVCLPWSHRQELDGRFEGWKWKYLRAGTREVKGQHLRRDLIEPASESMALAALANLNQELGTSIWVAGCGPRCEVHARYPEAGSDSRTLARHLLVDRMTGMARASEFEESSWLILYDLSNVGDVANFSEVVTGFRDAVAGRSRGKAIHPEVVGVPSERWPGIQIADVFGYYARHALATVLGVSGADPVRGMAFGRFLRPALKRSRTGALVGWARLPHGRPAEYVSPWGTRTPRYDELVAFRSL